MEALLKDKRIYLVNVFDIKSLAINGECIFNITMDFINKWAINKNDVGASKLQLLFVTV